MLIYSQPNQQKLRNIGHSPKVSLNLDGDGHGGNIIVITGEAQIAEDAPPATDVPEYLTKYGDGIKSIGLTPEGMAQRYAQAIRITPTDVRGH